MKYIVYARKSTEDKKKQVESIRDQLDEVKKINIGDGKIIETITEERTASKPGRKGFGKMMEMISNGEADGILCWDLDRLARNPIDAGAINWALQSGNLKEIRTPFNRYDETTESTILNIHFGMATDYTRKLRRNIRRGMRARFLEGFFLAGVPFGYKAAGKGLRVAGEHFDWVKKIFEMYVIDGFSYQKIANVLNESGVPTNRGGSWHLSSVEKILKNPFYVGEIHVNQADGFIIGNGVHAPAISKSLFRQCEEKRAGKRTPRNTKHSYPFAKKVKCACGRFLVNYRPKGKKNIYLECKNRDCGARFFWDGKSRKTLTETQLIEVILKILSPLNLSFEARKQFRADVRAELEKGRETLAEIEKSKRIKIAKCEEKIVKIEEMAIEGVFSPEKAKAKIAATQKEIDLLSEGLTDEKNEFWKENLEIIEMSCSILDFLGNKKIPGKKTAIRMFELFFKTLVFVDGRLHVEFSDLAEWLILAKNSDVQKLKFEPAKNPTRKREKGGPRGEVPEWWSLTSDHRTLFRQVKAILRSHFTDSRHNLQKKIRNKIKGLILPPLPLSETSPQKLPDL